MSLQTLADVRTHRRRSRCRPRSVACDSGARAVSSRPVAYPVARTRAQPSSAIARVRELAPVEREAATADALRQPEPEPLELADALVDPLRPRLRQARPFATCPRPVGRQLGQLARE